jgi:hypothetical protein
MVRNSQKRGYVKGREILVFEGGQLRSEVPKAKGNLRGI